MKFEFLKPASKDSSRLTYVHVPILCMLLINFKIYVTKLICMVSIYSGNNKNMNIKYMTGYFLKTTKNIFSVFISAD